MFNIFPPLAPRMAGGIVYQPSPSADLYSQNIADNAYRPERHFGWDMTLALDAVRNPQMMDLEYMATSGDLSGFIGGTEVYACKGGHDPYAVARACCEPDPMAFYMSNDMEADANHGREPEFIVGDLRIHVDPQYGEDAYFDHPRFRKMLGVQINPS